MLSDAQVLAESIRVVNQAFLGMLTTVDEQGVPHARWMGSATAENGLHVIYTLSAPNSRKVEQIRKNPNVCWVFSTEGYTDIVTLYGRASVSSSPLVAQRIWDRLMEHARLWCMAALGNRKDNLEMVTIETQVTALEYLSPRLGMYAPRRIELPATQTSG